VSTDSDTQIGHISKFKDRRECWHQIITDDLLMSYCRGYVASTNLTQPQTCTCCGWCHFGKELQDVMVGLKCAKFPRNLELLRLTDPFIVKHCVV